MKILAIIVILLIIIVLLIIASISQIQMAGIKVKDFVSFIKANEDLDRLAIFAKRYEKMSPQEQIIYLAEAEKVFNAFDKIPDSVWEDEQRKYDEVLDTYKNIKIQRWNEAREYELSTKVKTIKPKEIKIT
ncbi:unknown [Clostridium sp. CAG:793]|nr:unknown [Clostridium sp. CAG:793]